MDPGFIQSEPSVEVRGHVNTTYANVADVVTRKVKMQCHGFVGVVKANVLDLLTQSGG